MVVCALPGFRLSRMGVMQYSGNFLSFYGVGEFFIESVLGVECVGTLPSGTDLACCHSPTGASAQ